MRLPTVSQYKTQMNDLAKQFDEITRLQTKGRTAKELEHSSENPLLAEKIKAVSDSIQLLKGYQLNITLAESRSATTSSTAQEIVSVVGKIQDIIMNARNDTLSNTDRANMAEDLKGYLDTMQRLANTQDHNGEYIFSGMSVNTPPFVKDQGAWRYQGASDATKIALASNDMVTFNDSGYKVFGDIKTGNGLFTVTADASHNTGTGIASSVSGHGPASKTPDSYSLTFVTNTAGQLAYKIVGASTGQIVPALPATVPGDAPEYISGTDIQFEGLTLQVSGRPAVGDVFNVRESKSQSVFDTLEAVIATLSKPVDTDKDKADMHQVLGELSSSVQQAFNHFRAYLTEAGNRAKSVDDLKTYGERMISDQSTILDRMSSAHLEEVFPELTQRLTALELTQQSYIKIQETMQSVLTLRR